MLGTRLHCVLPWAVAEGLDPCSEALALPDAGSGREGFVLVSPCRTQACVLVRRSSSGAAAAEASAAAAADEAAAAAAAADLSYVHLPWSAPPQPPQPPQPPPPLQGEGSAAGAGAGLPAQPPPPCVSACLCVEDMLILASARNELALYLVPSLLQPASGSAHAPLACFTLPTASPVTHASCSTARLLDTPGRPYAPDMVYFTLQSGGAVSCAWPALRQHALGGAAAAAAAPAFNAWAFGGIHRRIASLACANPIGNTLFESFRAPTDLFANATQVRGGAGAAEPPRHDVLVAGGQAPTLASYTTPVERPTNELALMASSVGTALRRTLSGFATRLLGPELKTGLGSALGGGLKSAARWVGGSGGGAGAGAGAGGGTASSSGSGSGAALPPLPPPFTLPLDFSVEDGERAISSLTTDPSGRHLLACDSWGRVMLLDAGELVVLRLWKGYRDSSVGWLVHAQACGRRVLAPVILAPRRGLLEVWRPRIGPRFLALRVPRGARLVYSVQWGVEGGEAFPSPSCHVLSASHAEGGACSIVIQRLLPGGR